jgi:hypothetical protein
MVGEAEAQLFAAGPSRISAEAKVRGPRRALGGRVVGWPMCRIDSLNGWIKDGAQHGLVVCYYHALLLANDGEQYAPGLPPTRFTASDPSHSLSRDTLLGDKSQALLHDHGI